MKTTTARNRLYAAALGVALAVGFAPGLFNILVDPYRMHGLFDLGLEKKKVATKKHGPLYKVIEYPRKGGRYLVLGDSRSRALRDKLFHEVGFTDFYNFAYRGGTVPEMIDTYRYALERTEDLKGIVIGVPLRSMDEKFSGAKNQVPEAIDIKRNPLRYFGSLFVADTGAAVLEANHPGRMRSVKAAFEKIGGAFSIANSATASETITDECEQLCRSSNFMKDDDFIDFKGIRILKPRTTVGRDAGVTVPKAGKPKAIDIRRLQLMKTPPPPAAPTIFEDLNSFVTSSGAPTPPPATQAEPHDPKWEKRVEKGGRNDWRNFTYSEDYFAALKAIIEDAKARGIKVALFIPPTHVDMQRRIADFDRLGERDKHRARMAELAPVFDYDHPSAATAVRANFTDPYHFKANLARAIAYDLIEYFEPPRAVLRKIAKRRAETEKVAALPCFQPNGYACARAPRETAR